jgi:L-cysteine desulfidase
MKPTSHPHNSVFVAMKTHKHQFLRRSCLAGLMLVVLTGFASHAQVTVVSDDCTAVNTASGFALGQGINSGVYPPFSNRITGTVAANLRYYKSGGESALFELRD